jgi:hypothetical protein
MIAPAAFGAGTSNIRPAIQLIVPSSTVNGTSATITYTINRGENQVGGGSQVASLTCSLTGPTTSSSCGTTSTPATHETDGTVNLMRLESGTYHYTVNLLLTDGGTATASGSFTVVAFAGQAACLALPDGTFTPGGGVGIIWTCTATAQNVQDVNQQALGLVGLCGTDGGDQIIATNSILPGAVTYTCEIG